MPGSGSQARARDVSVMVRLTSDEKQRYAVLAERNHVSLPELFRLAVSLVEMQEAMR